MLRPWFNPAVSVVVLIGFVSPHAMTLAQEAPPPAPQQAMATAMEGRDLQLEVFINDASTNLIGAFKQLPDGTLVATPDMVKGVELKPAREATGADGLLHLDRLTGVSYRIDEASQSLYVTSADGAREPHIIDVNPKPPGEMPAPQTSYGTVLNYTLFASSDGAFVDDIDTFSGLSGAVDARLFSPYGTLSQSAIATTATAEFVGLTRLQTTWTYSDPGRLITYRAGDTISGGLSWTRPVWLGGVQVQRNFALRPDLITLPIPVFSGSAAVPSTVDVYTHNVKTFTGDVPAGPYEVANLPITNGAGNARVVLRDAMGRETVTTLPFYSSSQLLRQGLYDFSAETGFARRYYGVESYDYDDRPVASGTVRYGVADWLTLESHTEGGAGLINGGAGAVFAVGPLGVASLAFAGSNAEGSSGTQVSASNAEDSSGSQVSASLETGYRGVSFYARTQRTFGDYEDIACVTAGDPSSSDQAFFGFPRFSVCPPKALDQVSLGVPLPFDPSTFNLSYTQLESALGDRDRIVGLTYNRPFFRNSTIYAGGFKDLDDEDGFSAFVGISVPLGSRTNASAGVESGPDGARAYVDASRSEQQEVGSYGWRVREAEGDITDRSAAVSYRAPFGRIEVGAQQYDDNAQGTAQFDGSIALVGGGVFIGNRIDDAFAVVDVGAPGVAVQYENRPVGETNRRGQLLVPYLNSYQKNKISIDPKNLPVDADIPKTRDDVVPADRNGVVVEFGITESTHAALISFVDASGAPIEVAAQGHLQGGDQSFVVGYDGQAYLQGLAAHNAVTVDLPDGASCQAEFDYIPRPGEQVTIKGVVCQ